MKYSPDVSAENAAVCFFDPEGCFMKFYKYKFILAQCMQKLRKVYSLAKF